MKALRNKASGLAIAAALGFLPATAMAADAPDSQKQPTQVGEVVVTAQKTAQKLQDVPLSVTAITGKDLKATGATNLEQLQYSVPGLSMAEYGPGSTEEIQIRGISNINGSPTVGIYIDEVPVTSTQSGVGIDVRMLDLDRVEVLRGPQGTLYGDASMGGTIRYITANPSLTDFTGNIEAEINSVDGGGTGYKANAVLSAPLVKDVLGIRLMASDDKEAGWIDNVALGRKDDNAADIKTYRAKILFEPAPGTKISLMAMHQDETQAEQNFGVNGVTTAVFAPYNNNKYDIFNGVLNQDLGFANLVESLGYLDNRTKDAFDISAFYVPILPLFGVPPGYVTAVGLTGDDEMKVFTNETRLSSKPGSGPLNWTVGYFYRDFKFGGTSTTVTEPNALPFTILSATSTSESRSWAIFGEANYQITPQLNALVGLRYFEDHRTQTADSVQFGFPVHDVGDSTFHSLNPRFNLRYEFSPESMVYLNIAKGFRSGGFNNTSAGLGIFTVPPTYAPDSLWSYEVGTKQQLLDHKLELQAAVYYEDWKNVQSNAFVPGSALIIVENSGHVTGWGADLMATWHATPDLDLSATYGWNNLHYVGVAAQGPDKNVGDPVDYAVHDSGSASLSYHRPIGDNLGFFRLDYQYAGKAQITVRNFVPPVIKPLPVRDSLAAHLGMDIGSYEVSLFGTNLLNDRKPIIPGPYGVLLENVEQTPRTIGINFKAHW